METGNIVFDEYQQKVIDAENGRFLVLAPPGCGKTEILAHRIFNAHKKGVDYSDMMCLTFTNRASRNMIERINRSGEDTTGLFVGNVHRFCSRFLFENAIIPAETGVIDDDDALSIIARYLNEDETFVAANGRRRREYFSAVQLSALMYQIEHSHPKELRLHPEVLSADEVKVLRAICDVARQPFTQDNLVDIYRHADTYRTLIAESNADIGVVRLSEQFLHKMEVARYYVDYKKDNHLVDFEDLLLLTYDALAGNVSYRRYPWIQVDEVQDLTPMQLKIIDMLSVDYFPNGSFMYLGDEQQAIFSFMGAKMSTLQLLKERCEGHVFRLMKNHRSPKYLMQVFNYYAYSVLGIQKDLLPTSDNMPLRIGNELSLLSSNTLDNEYNDVAQQALRMSRADGSTTAVIVCSNSDADIVSSRMTDLGVKHFKVSGTDMFSLPEVKLMLAHLSVFANERNFIAWARILKGFRVYEQSASARKFMRELIDRSLLPTDLMNEEDEGSYVMRFEKLCSDKDRTIVVFDTETTGLSVTEDDIVQIAAVKMKGGEVVPGSGFKVFIKTDRAIPLMLGDVENPIIEEMKHNPLHSHEEALAMFMDYVGDDVLLGHNADYDYNILDCNLKRYLPDVDLKEKCPICFDSLKLTRLLEPDLYQYKLKYLLEVLHLEGENSHLADADVAATCNVVKHCLKRAQAVIPLQKEFLSLRSTRERAAILRRNYQPLYSATLARQYEVQSEGKESLLVAELRWIYGQAVEGNCIKPVKGYEYLLRYVAKELVDTTKEKTLHEQIANHVLEICTLKESDLCTGDVVDETVFVTTVHKAKGLEFDNVIVFDVADDRYPGFFAKNNPLLEAEDARKLYVAMTRAKRNLMVAVGAIRHDYHGMPVQRNLSRFMTPVLRFFTTANNTSEDNSEK